MMFITGCWMNGGIPRALGVVRTAMRTMGGIYIYIFYSDTRRRYFQVLVHFDLAIGSKNHRSHG